MVLPLPMRSSTCCRERHGTVRRFHVVWDVGDLRGDLCFFEQVELWSGVHMDISSGIVAPVAHVFAGGAGAKHGSGGFTYVLSFRPLVVSPLHRREFYLAEGRSRFSCQGPVALYSGPRSVGVRCR